MSGSQPKACPRYTKVRGRHLTATDRQLVAYVLENKITKAHTKRKLIDVTRREPGRMDFTITTQENDDHGRPSPRIAAYEIEIDE